MKKIVLTPNPYRDRNFKYVTLADKLLREAGLETRICLAFDVDRSFELHRQRGYSVEQLTQWLEEAGFTEIRTWGDGKLRRPVPGEDRVYFTCIRK